MARRWHIIESMKHTRVMILVRAMSLCMIFGLSSACFAAHLPDSPVIHIEDVTAFYKLYDAANGQPTAAQLQHDYLDPGSEGLHHLASVRNVTGTSIANAIANHPEIYSGARQCLAVLPRVRQRVKVALRELGQLYPQARFPPVTIAVGRGKPVGVGSAVTGLQIGLEALCAVKWMDPNVEDRFVQVIAHEYIHVQQVPALDDDEHPTLLERSLIEGAAEFGAELLTGQPGEVTSPQMRASTQGHEKEIETAFLTDEDNTDLSKWLDNSTYDQQGDLGYWVGYRIVKCYFQHAGDKRQALREIIEMTDPKALLAKSEWVPGIKLQ
jgi:Predicted Zn-dependent protease (DUF2268)